MLMNSNSIRMQRSHMYSVFFAPRGNVRMSDLGSQIGQQYLDPFDKLIGVVGDAGSGKSMLLKGMFPGLELTNDDEGVNVRPLPLLNIDETGFYTPHTYHLDIRFESAFTQMHELAGAILEALNRGKRVVVEHFDLIYPFLNRNAQLLIGVGEEVIVTRPSIFGPLPEDVRKIVYPSVKYRLMAHTAEDLCEMLIRDKCHLPYAHADVRRGFLLGFDEKPDFDLEELEKQALDMIAKDVPVSYKDENHITFGDVEHYCTGPRMHVRSTGAIENFKLIKEFSYDPDAQRYFMVGLIGNDVKQPLSDLNHI